MELEDLGSAQYSAAGRGVGTSFPSSRSSPGAFCPPWRPEVEKEVTSTFEMLAQSTLQPSLQHFLLNPHPPSADPQPGMK